MTIKQAEVEEEADIVVALTTEAEEGMKGKDSPMSKETQSVTFNVIIAKDMGI